MLASSPVSILNQNNPDLEIPNRFSESMKRSSFPTSNIFGTNVMLIMREKGLL